LLADLVGGPIAVSSAGLGQRGSCQILDQTNLDLKLTGIRFLYQLYCSYQAIWCKKITGYLVRIIPLAGLAVLINNNVSFLFRLNADLIVYDPKHQPNTFPGYQKEIRNLLVFCIILMVIGLGITISFIQRWNEEVNLRQLSYTFGVLLTTKSS
jgi:hypothetical protein